jgi:hypothetical protein
MYNLHGQHNFFFSYTKPLTLYLLMQIFLLVRLNIFYTSLRPKAEKSVKFIRLLLNIVLIFNTNAKGLNIYIIYK